MPTFEDIEYLHAIKRTHPLRQQQALRTDTGISMKTDTDTSMETDTEISMETDTEISMEDAVHEYLRAVKSAHELKQQAPNAETNINTEDTARFGF
jgi:hypothetical protein